MALGFVNTQIKNIYIGNKAVKSPWYFWNKEKEEVEPIEATCLGCVLINIDVIHREYKGKTYPKLSLSINAGETLRILCGLETWFSKTLVARLNQLSVQELSQQIYIHARMGEEGGVIFGYLQNSYLDWVQKAKELEYGKLDEVALAEMIYAIRDKLKQSAQQALPPEVESEAELMEATINSSVPF
jgi:hypothetical protein